MLGIFSNLSTFQLNVFLKMVMMKYFMTVTLLTQVIQQDSHISLRDSVVIKREEPKPNLFSFG